MKTSKQIQAEITRLQKAEQKAAKAEERQRNLKALYKAAEDFAEYFCSGDLLKAISILQKSAAENEQYAIDKEKERQKKEAAKERRKQREAERRAREAAQAQAEQEGQEEETF